MRGCSTGRTSGSSRSRESRTSSPARGSRCSTSSRGGGPTRASIDSSRSWPRSSDRWGSIRPHSRRRRVPCSTWSGPSAGPAHAAADGRLVAPGLGHRQRGAGAGAEPVPRHHPGRPHAGGDRGPVRRSGPDAAGRGEGLPPATGDHPHGRSLETATGTDRAGLPDRRRVRRRPAPLRRPGGFRLLRPAELPLRADDDGVAGRDAPRLQPARPGLSQPGRGTAAAASSGSRAGTRPRSSSVPSTARPTGHP